jgi:hypothetical protein
MTMRTNAPRSQIPQGPSGSSERGRHQRRLLCCAGLGRPSRTRVVYPQGMAVTNPLEDERGVDRAAIRELLRLTPEERVTRLVETVAVWSEMLQHRDDTTKAE